MPFGIVGIGLGQAVADSKAVAIRLQRGGEVALRELRLADLCIARSEIALPAGIAGIGLGQAVGNGEFLE